MKTMTEWSICGKLIIVVISLQIKPHTAGMKWHSKKDPLFSRSSRKIFNKY